MHANTTFRSVIYMFHVRLWKLCLKSYVRESATYITFLPICQLNFEPFYITYISACLAHLKFLPTIANLTYDSANNVNSMTEHTASNT